MKDYTLVFVQNQNDKKILLGLKKRGFGVGKWNGFGGKVEKNETVFEGAKRELKEECGLIPINMKKLGTIIFDFEGKPTLLAVHVFKSYDYEGTLTESEEMKPQWFDINDIPYDKMWLDDEIWYPLMLNDKLFEGKFYFRGHSKILKYELKEV